MSPHYGGRGWIRTIEAEKQQIYSLPPLATRELSHIKLGSFASETEAAGQRTQPPFHPPAAVHYEKMELVDGLEPPTC